MSTSLAENGLPNYVARWDHSRHTDSPIAADVSTERQMSGDYGLGKIGQDRDGERTFTLFPKLPAELRFRVWKYAHPDPRYIEVQMINGSAGADQARCWRVKTKHEAPTLFFVCHKSRAEVIKRCVLLRGNEPGSSAIYYDTNVDVLVFRYTINDDRPYEYERWLCQLSNDLMVSINYVAWQCVDLPRLVALPPRKSLRSVFRRYLPPSRHR
jgi:hypothetical protein